MMAKFSKLITQLILIFLTTTGLVQANQQTRSISSSNIQSSIDNAYVEFKFARTIKVTHDKLKNPDRVYFDFTSSHIDKNLIDAVNQLNKNPGVIESAKVGQNQPNIVRFVLQITPNAQVLVTPDSQRLRVSISTTQSPDLIENLYRAETNQTKNKIWDQDHYIIVIDAGHGMKTYVCSKSTICLIVCKALHALHICWLCRSLVSIALGGHCRESCDGLIKAELQE